MSLSCARCARPHRALASPGRREDGRVIHMALFSKLGPFFGSPNIVRHPRKRDPNIDNYPYEVQFVRHRMGGKRN